MIAAPIGVTEALVAIVIAQAISTIVISAIGTVALRRFPAARARGLGEDVREIRTFVLQSSIATGVISLRTTLIPLILGVVSGTTQVGLFRIATTPQTGLAAASSPARLVLLTEQTRDWEKGARSSVLAGVRSYSKWAGAIMVVAVPVFFVAMPWLIRVVFGSEYDGAVHAARVILIAAAIHFALGWTKSLPVTIGRPRLRIVTHGLETIVAIPLVALLGAEWGATGAAVGVLVSTVVFALAWLVVIVRLRDEVHASERAGGAAFQPEGRRRLRNLAPDPEGPASPPHAGRLLTERGTTSIVTTAAVEPAVRPYPGAGCRGGPAAASAGCAAVREVSRRRRHARRSAAPRSARGWPAARSS